MFRPSRLRAIGSLNTSMDLGVPKVTSLPGKSKLQPAGGTSPASTSFMKSHEPEPRSAFDQNRAGALRSLVLAHDPEPLGDIGVGLDQPAEVAAETILVELVVRLDVP